MNWKKSDKIGIVEGMYRKGLCLLWAGAIFCSAYAFSSRIQTTSIGNLLTRSAIRQPYRLLDYVSWFACRGFCLFAFAVLSLLLIYGCKCFRESPTTVMVPTILFLILNELHRNQVTIRPDLTSLVILDLIGIIVGIVIYVRFEIRKDKLTFPQPG